MDLETIFHDLNALHFESEMPLPKLAWNSRLASTAGRFGPGIPWRGTKPVIEIATYLRDIPEGEMHVRDTMLHEMIHYWLWHRGLPYGHTPAFLAKMKATGAKRFNPVPKLRPIKHHYRCRECAVVIGARRKLAEVACSRCCNKFNGGVFSRKYLLELTAAPPAAANVGTPERIPSECDSDGDGNGEGDEGLEEGLLLPLEKVMEKLQSIREMLRNASIRR